MPGANLDPRHIAENKTEKQSLPFWSFYFTVERQIKVD